MIFITRETNSSSSGHPRMPKFNMFLQLFDYYIEIIILMLFLQRFVIFTNTEVIKYGIICTE